MRKDRRYEAKGIDPATGRRKSYYSRVSQADAKRQAHNSFGFQKDDSFAWYFASVYVPSVQNRSDNWKDQIAWAMDGYWLPVFGKKPLRSITRADVQKEINRMRLAPKSIDNAYKVLSAMMALAEVDGEIVRTPCLKIRKPAIPVPDKTALHPSELLALLNASPDLIRPVVLLCGFAGLRIGEACAVTWGNIDGKGILKVRQQILQPKGGAIISRKLKTPSSLRDIPLPAPMIEALRSCNQKSGIWVCSNVDYGYLLPRNVAEDLTLACKAAGVPRISPHELRHTFDSMLKSEVEAPGPIVDALMGHKKAAYDHTSTEQKRRWMAKLWNKVLQSDDIQTVVTEAAV